MSSTFCDRLIELRLTRAYIDLLLAPADEQGARTIALARFGKYEVRLSEFAKDDDETTPTWLEIYARHTQASIDSCSCDDLEEAIHAAKDFISQARALNEEVH